MVVPSDLTPIGRPAHGKTKRGKEHPSFAASVINLLDKPP